MGGRDLACWDALELVEARSDLGDLGTVTLARGDPVEVITEEPAVGDLGPFRQASHLARSERGDLGVDTERVARLGPLGESELGQPIEGSVESSMLADALAEPQGAGQLCSWDPGGHALSPENGEAPQDRDAARADHRPPALLDVGMRQVETDSPHSGIGMR